MHPRICELRMGRSSPGGDWRGKGAMVRGNMLWGNGNGIEAVPPWRLTVIGSSVRDDEHVRS